ncbi:MAG TPA: flagellar hook-length control protein FliK, partial [Burkholderiaceae bacterium]|nr:flagellar hook-length control protein FliK [Burkholderiaceae bacterium]
QTGQGGGAGSAGGGAAGGGATNTATPSHVGTAASVGSEATATAGATAAGPAGAAARGDAATLGAALGGPTLAAAAAAGANPVPGLDPQAQLLVRQQLDVLANQSFTWRGEAWPDAPMDWEISRREASSQDADASSQTDHWATRISIQLPQLGTVHARLTLAGQQLVMHLVAPESAPLLAEHTETLRARYSSQGFQLSQISVAAADGESSAATGTSHRPDGTPRANADDSLGADNSLDGAEPAAS